MTHPITIGEWAEPVVAVNPLGILIARTGNPGWVMETKKTDFRGGCTGLFKNYEEPIPVESRNASSAPAAPMNGPNGEIEFCEYALGRFDGMPAEFEY